MLSVLSKFVILSCCCLLFCGYHIRHNLGAKSSSGGSSELLLPSRHLSITLINYLSYPIVVYLASPLCSNKKWFISWFDKDCISLSIQPGEQVFIDDVRDVVFLNLGKPYNQFHYNEIDLLNSLQIFMRRDVFFMEGKISWNVCMRDQSFVPYGISLSTKPLFLPSSRSVRQLKVSFMETDNKFLSFKQMRCIIQEN